MSKTKILILGFLVIFFSLGIPTTSFAEPVTVPNCSMTYEPDPIVVLNGHDTVEKGTQLKFRVTVNSPGIYNLYFADGKWFGDQKDLTPDENGLLGGGPQTITVDTGNNNSLKPGPHTIKVVRKDSTGDYCKLPYMIQVENTNRQVACNIESINPTNEQTPVKLNGTIHPQDTYRFLVPGTKTHSNTFKPNPDDSFPEQNLGLFNPGAYTIVLQRGTSQVGTNDLFWYDTNCVSQLTVKSHTELPDQNLGSPTTIGNAIPEGASFPQATPCTDPKKCSSAEGPVVKGCTDDSKNPGIATAIGCIRTNPVELTKSFLKFALGISGGLAFLLMIFGAFQMLTSAGNPETLNAGKDRLTSAVIGLLLIIFSVLLLQIIGVDILGLGAQFNPVPK